MQKLDKAMCVIGGEKSNRNSLKEGRLQLIIMDGLRNFLAMFQSSVGKGGKRGGRQSLENQNVFDVIMTVTNTEELTPTKLGRILSRSLNVT